MPKKTIDELNKPEKIYPTVGDMLNYIVNNNIPMDAIILTEQLQDYYLENEDDTQNWDYCIAKDFYFDLKLIPAHNDFGYAFDKKAFIIWMHY